MKKIREFLAIGFKSSYRGGGQSVGQLIEDVGFSDWQNSLTVEVLSKVVDETPSLIEDWLLYSSDKRTSCGWYLIEKRGGYEVGRIDVEIKPVWFADANKAVASYAIKEIGFWSDMAISRSKERSKKRKYL